MAAQALGTGCTQQVRQFSPLPVLQGPGKAQQPALGCMSEHLDPVTLGAGEGECGGQGTHRQRGHQQDEEMQSHGHGHSCQQPGVQPGRHPQQGLVLRDAAKGTGHSPWARTPTGPATGTHPPSIWRCRRWPEPQHFLHWTYVLEHFWGPVQLEGVSLLPTQPPGACPGARAPFCCPSDLILAPLFHQTPILAPFCPLDHNSGPTDSDPNPGHPNSQTPILDPCPPDPNPGPPDFQTPILGPLTPRPQSWTP